MYDERVKQLRDNAEFLVKASSGYLSNSFAETMIQAADVIEELAAFKAQITDGHLYLMRDGVLYEAKIEMPKGKIVNLPPIEFAEPPKEET